MKKYKVILQKDEREDLEAITRKGSHQSQRVVNALVLLNCDEGEFNEYRMRGVDVANVLRISMRKVDRVKKRFVEDGLEAALGSRQGQRVHERKTDGDFEAHLVVLSCSQTDDQGNRTQDYNRLGAVSPGHSHALQECREDHAGNGQLEYAQSGISVSDISARSNQGVVGSFRVCLHAEAWQLAQRSGNRTECDDPPMSVPAYRQHYGSPN